MCKKKTKRYSYSTVGYGVFSLVGQVYDIGRIEVYDRKEGSGYSDFEFGYWVPHEQAAEFRDFWDNFETDFPIWIGSPFSTEDCLNAVAKHLGCTVEQLTNREFIKEFYKNKYKETKPTTHDEWDEWANKLDH